MIIIFLEANIRKQKEMFKELVVEEYIILLMRIQHLIFHLKALTPDKGMIPLLWAVTILLVSTLITPEILKLFFFINLLSITLRNIYFMSLYLHFFCFEKIKCSLLSKALISHSTHCFDSQ